MKANLKFFKRLFFSTKGFLSLFFTIILFKEIPLHASIEGDVPELPNLFTLIHEIFSYTAFKHWESVLFSIFLAVVISLVFHMGAKNSSLIPSGLQNFLEWVVGTIHDGVIEILGHKGEKFVPFLGTLFIYILCMNWLVLIPLMKPPSSDFNVTVALSVCVFCLVQYLNIKNFGVLGFLHHMAGSPKTGLEWALAPLMFVIEIFTQISRPITLALRLFGNVVGEDILIGAFALFGVALFASSQYPVGLPLQLPFLFLALLTGLMQALVFTLLSTIYILLSIPSDEH